MKSSLSIPTEVFYNPSTALAGSWYGQTRTRANRHHSALPFLLEPDDRKQEVVCSVIFVLCLLFSIAICIGQFAVS